MANNPIRRAQLIAPFGVGAMVVGPDGISMISGGLDHWYEKEDGSGNIDHSEFMITEWRLQRRLGVNHLRLPPDFRTHRQGTDVPNLYLRVPFLRFPQWHFCPYCKRLQEVPLSARGQVRCVSCEAKGLTIFLAQVPIVAICEHGHIQDFPFREWVHKELRPSCGKPLSLIASGGASLAAQQVKCECGASRSLSLITAASTDGTTYLSENVENSDHPYLCTGYRPWLGANAAEPCTNHIRGSLRSASNTYFADVQSAIYIPRAEDPDEQDLLALFESPQLGTLLDLYLRLGDEPKPKDFRQQYPEILQPYSDAQISQALATLTTEKSTVVDGNATVQTDDEETAFRRVEYRTLSAPRDYSQLMVKRAPLHEASDLLADHFDRIMLIPRLRETRALAGFSRVFPDADRTPQERQALLRRHMPADNDTWLPAYEVYGEGIFLVLNEARLRVWETIPEVTNRVATLQARYDEARTRRRLQDRKITPRAVLLHTLAHLLINQLTFECGYSSASLRERLYVSSDRDAPMAGVLIYTAAGDSEGTMGGLVRMGQFGILEPVVERALVGATWCSADPICMEAGDHGGQGPDSCNLAACHNCALIPETACEMFNTFLDRALVVGNLKDASLGYFNPDIYSGF